MLAGRSRRRKYTPDDGDLVRLFYVPALEDAKRYDRLTGYFNAGALAPAARGIEGLVRNRGCMRFVVGCTLPPAEIPCGVLRQRLGELLNLFLDVGHGDPPMRERIKVGKCAAVHSGSANTKMLLPLLGRSSGVIALQREALPPVPVPATTYCRPSTA